MVLTFPLLGQLRPPVTTVPSRARRPPVALDEAGADAITRRDLVGSGPLNPHTMG
jgi:hypothetical protein